MTVHYIFIDDAVENGDAERFRALLSSGPLRVTAIPPRREGLLVAESELELGEFDGYIVDINLRDHVPHDQPRFVGTGAGLAQDLRVLQASSDTEDSQRPRPIVRLCAAQVFQRYLSADNSAADVFDIGFDKETVADVVTDARAQIAALPDIYNQLLDKRDPSHLIGLKVEEYQALHSAFRAAFQLALSKRVHEAANFILNGLLFSPGLLIDEKLLAIRLGVDISQSKGWQALLAQFDGCRYNGAGASGYPRWWMSQVLTRFSEFDKRPLYGLTASERIETSMRAGFSDLSPIENCAAAPGEKPWVRSQSEDEELRLPTDPRFAFPIGGGGPYIWLDEPLWCLEQAKQNRRSILMSDATRERLAKVLSGTNK